MPDYRDRVVGRPKKLTPELIDKIVRAVESGLSYKRTARIYGVADQTVRRAAVFCREKENATKLLSVTEVQIDDGLVIPKSCLHLLPMTERQYEHLIYGAVLLGADTIKVIADATGVNPRKVRRVLQKGVADKVILVGKRKLALNKQGLEERGEEYVYTTR